VTPLPTDAPIGQIAGSARLAGIKGLLEGAEALENLKHKKVASFFEGTAELASALHVLYEDPYTRTATLEPESQKTLGVHIAAALGLTALMRHSGRQDFRKIGECLEVSLLNAVMYPRAQEA
jgi:hypothetical protein